jgi:signal transduction histidine kinase
MLKTVVRNTLLVLMAALLSLTITVTVMVFVAAFSERSTPERFNYFSIYKLSQALTEDGKGGYSLSEEGQAQLTEFGAWAILLDGSGDVVWSAYQPADVPNHYTLAEVAGFSRWYLHDYPVNVWQYGDGLLVAGAPKGSAWKYSLYYAESELDNLAFLVPLTFLGTLLLTLLLGRSSMKKEQARRDIARSRWIDGISHDIRTPLSIIMGYAGEWAADPALPAERRGQASAMVNACTGVKNLVADLNLTMRLDYEMQPLRKESVSPAALLRTVAAEALNSGLAADLEIDIDPAAEGQHLCADPVLLRRALMNLIQNAVRHGGNGIITLRLLREKRAYSFIVENPCTEDAAALLPELNHTKAQPKIARDGTAAHGTGLRLVQQIARAHGGKLCFCMTEENKTLRAQLKLPVSRGARG